VNFTDVSYYRCFIKNEHTGLYRRAICYYQKTSNIERTSNRTNAVY
jgi:hypothetical protein